MDLVKVTLLPSTCGGVGVGSSQYLTTFLIDDRVAIDAGSLGFHREPHDQAAVRHVFLSHSHLDHLASLPIFLENIAGLNETPVTVYASEPVQASLRQDLFNDRLWPNFLKLSHAGGPFLRLATIRSGEPVDVEKLRITPVAVDHVVPTLGFIVEGAGAAIVIVSDTGPTQEIWDRANRLPNLKAVFLEATFPQELSRLAATTKHLSSFDFLAEAGKLHPNADVFAVHLKAQFRERLIEEVGALPDRRIKIAESDVVYEFV
jgi:ribonuclease BN (tRNA processing enzyme)